MRRQHIAPVLASLDWLLVGSRIEFKILNLQTSSLWGSFLHWSIYWILSSSRALCSTSFFVFLNGADHKNGSGMGILNGIRMGVGVNFTGSRIFFYYGLGLDFFCESGIGMECIHYLVTLRWQTIKCLEWSVWVLQFSKTELRLFSSDSARVL